MNNFICNCMQGHCAIDNDYSRPEGTLCRLRIGYCGGEAKKFSPQKVRRVEDDGVIIEEWIYPKE